MRRITIGSALAAALALWSGNVPAADQLVAGKKLLIKNPASGPANNKIVYLSKDPAIAQPSGVTEDPRCTPDGTVLPGGASAVLTVTGSPSGETFSIPLTCHLWSVNAAGNTFKYRDYGGATCKILIVKNAKLVKAVCKGPQVSYDLGIAETNVDVVLRTGPTNRYCSAFNATTAGCQVPHNGSNGKSYVARNCTSAPSCGASPSGAFLDVVSPY
jgi:hypothetical protein